MKDLTVGDDYIAPCPHCLASMNVGKFTTQPPGLQVGIQGVCQHCDKKWEIHRIDYIPNVWFKKAE